MKNFFYGCLIVVIAVVLSLAANFGLSSCDNPVISKMTTSVEKADIASCLDSIVNPQFTTFSEVVNYKENLLENKNIDSVFFSIPDAQLRNVIGVLMKKKGLFNKSDIVHEYINGKDVYKNLPPPTQGATSNVSTTTTETPTKIPGVSNVGTTTVMEAPPTRVGDDKATQVSYSYKDTTINGKHARMEIKTMTYE